MEHVTLIFGRGNAAISKIILFVSRSEWSHVAYIDEKSGYIIEASGGVGVIVSTFERFKQRYPTYEIARVPVKNASQFRDIMISAIGSEYDFKAILGILLRREWDELDKWTCSELIARATQLFRPDQLYKVTQEHIHMISEPCDFDFSKYCTVDVKPSLLQMMGFY